MNASLLRLWHGRLVAARFYPIALSSTVAMSALVVRIAITRRITFIFLAWNLALAWVPYLLTIPLLAVDPARWTTSRRVAVHRYVPLAALGTLWLLFLPNAPYLVTDIVHLRSRAEIPIWYDASLLVSFAWAGFALMSGSLLRVHSLVERRTSRRTGWVFVATTACLSGVGVYVGRFLRWNSWDAMTRPQSLARDAITSLLHPLAHLQAVWFSAMLAIVTLTVYLFAAIRAPDREPAD